MARLLGIRRLEPVVDLNPSESTANLTNFTQEPEYFQNPSYQEDSKSGRWVGSPVCVAFSLTNGGDLKLLNNNSTSAADQNSKSSSTPPPPPTLTPGDSGIVLVDEGSSSLNGVSVEKGAPNGRLPQQTWSPDDRAKPTRDREHKESLLAICVQVFIPFLIAGTGTCGAGIVLDYVEYWTVFQKVSELFILVPTLSGLKGNLEMTLASRVSTQANLGKLDSLSDKWKMSWGNMALIQCQATVMGFLAAAFATTMSISKDGFDLNHALLLCASSLFTAVMASFILGAVTLAVVVLSYRCNINPDNVATPIAASVGDVTTLGILAFISSYLYKAKENYVPAALIISIFLLLIPVWAYLSYKNPFVRQVLYTGWVPVIMALVITSIGGSISRFSVKKFQGFAIFQPVINGVAGNLVAVQASRISTYFHQKSEKPGSRPPDGSALCVTPFSAFFGKSAHARTARILLAMVIPGHLLFGYGITLIKGGDTVLTLSFLPIYITSAFIQVSLLLYIAQCLIQILWRFKVDPDNSAIPLLTALGDFSGMACLTIAFFIQESLNL